MSTINKLPSSVQADQDRPRLQAGLSPWDAGFLAFFILGAILWGLLIFDKDGPVAGVHWAWFAYGFMGLANAAFVTILVVGLRWWLRRDYSKAKITEEEKKVLDSTAGFNLEAYVGGICERAVFTTLALLLITRGMQDGPLVQGNIGVLASIAGGWVVLKTIMGWRRVSAGDPAIVRLSHIAITGSLVSVSLAILAGVLTLRIYDSNFP